MKCSKRHFQETASAGAVNVDTSAPFGRFAFRGLLSAAARLLDPEVPDVLRKKLCATMFRAALTRSMASATAFGVPAEG
jgi:hypothetical protein